MKKIIQLFTLLLIAAFAALGTAFADNPAGSNPGSTPYFRAKLTGSKEVPPVSTNARGEVTLEALAGDNQITYKLTDQNIQNITAAHIHMGKKGQEGPPVVSLYSGPEKKGPFTGTLAAGTITDKDLVGPLKGKHVSDLIGMMESGDAYVNVHTRQHPTGEIRGELAYAPVGE